MVGRTNALIGALVSSVNGMTGAVILNANIAYDPSVDYEENTIGDALKQGGGGGGAVQSVNGMTGDVVLNANIAYNPETTYDEGTIGDALQDTVTREDLDDIRELPETSSEENGKVLAVVDGEWAAAEIPEGNLPPVTSADNGKVLGVVEGEWAVKDDEGGSLPDVTSADNGKVLGVVNGEWEKTAIPSGNLPPVTAADNGKVLGVVDGAWGVAEGGSSEESETLEPVVEYAEGLKVEVDQSDTTTYFRRTGYLDGNGVYQKGSATTVKCYYIPVLLATPGKMIVTGNADLETYIAFLTNVPSNNGDTAAFAGDYTSRIAIAPNTTYEFDVPANTSYIYVYAQRDDAGIPSSIIFVNDMQTGIYDDISTLCGTWESISIANYPLDHYWWASGKVTNNGYTMDFPVTAGQKVRITNENTTSCQYRLTQDTLASIGVGNDILNSTPVYYLNTANNVLRVDEFYVPEGYNHLIVFHHQDNQSTRAPSSIEFMTYGSGSDSGDTTPVAITELIANDEKRIQAIGLTPILTHDTNGWDVPDTIQLQNVIDKCNRLRFLQWTPLRDCATRYDVNGGQTDRPNGGMSPAGIPFPTGVPYSSNWQDYKYVGITVTINTFLSAVHNPYSLIYTENLASNHKKTAWGRKWIVGNGTCYYGLVCCAFTSAATKSEMVWNNGDIPNVREFTLIGHTSDIDLDIIQIGDIFNDSSHASVVYSVKRDANGHMTDIKIAQSGGTFYGCNITALTRAQLLEAYGRGASGGGKYLYKYNNLYKNTDFTPLPTDIVEIGQSLLDNSAVTYPTYPTYTSEICTFAGDKATFARGYASHLIVINYNLDGNSMGTYDRVRLYKDGTTPTLVGEWTPTQANATLDGIWTPDTSFVTEDYPNPVDMTNHAVVVSTRSNQLDAGKYYAVLSDGTTDSLNKTEFEVIDNPIVSVVDRDGTYKINLSNRIDACYIGTLNSNDGDPCMNATVIHELTYAEEAGKYVLVNKADVSGIAKSSLYIRLHTPGEYGVAACVKKVFT